MLRHRLLILLGGSLLAASGALADDIGYIDCVSHSEDTQIFAKARKTPEVVASVPCGERFTILIYGFVFSRIETSDGKIGFLYSNLIAIDHSGIPVQQQAAVRKPAVAQPNPPAAAQSVAAAPQPAPAQPASVQPAAAQPAPVAAPAQAAAPALSFPEKTGVVVLSDPPAASQPQSAAVLVAPAPAAPAQADPAPASSAPSSVSSSPAPEPPAPAAPEPAPARVAPAKAAAPAPEPAPAPAIRPANVRSSWERPIPSAHTPPHLELFGGYAFARTVSAGTSTNLNGAMGSFGWNFKPWLQIVGDTTYNFVTVGTTKNVLYGNHYGPRYYFRRPNRWHATPFVEGLVGASRADTTVSGVGGYTNSQNCISYKVGGGLDINPSRHLEIRMFNVDYYRTSFGTNASQNNYWVSTGIVVRLFGGGVD